LFPAFADATNRLKSHLTSLNLILNVSGSVEPTKSRKYQKNKLIIKDDYFYKNL
jgi:hypothetical protein